MSGCPRLSRVSLWRKFCLALVAVVPLVGAVRGAAADAVTDGYPSQPTIEARVAKVRAALAHVDESGTATGHSGSSAAQRLAQWFNWNNWPNYWRNWGNYWRNY